MSLSFIGMDAVKSDNFYNYQRSKFESLITTQNNSEAIDIYFLPPGLNVYAAAEASPSGKALVLGGGNTIYGTPLPETSLISHEMGHCLSLIHTFFPLVVELDNVEYDGRFCGPGILFTDPCKCGDFVSDTPYDPASFCFTYLNSTSGACEYLDTDPHGELQPICDIGSIINPYGPDLIIEYDPTANPPINNMMSYSPWECLSSFTEGQARRMKKYLSTCQPFQQVVENNSIRIAGGLSINYDFSLSQCIPGIIVEPGATLTIKQNLNFMDNSKIVVKPTGRLNVEGATLSGCSNHYWQGIEVYGNPAVDQIPFSDQGYVYLAYNAAIKKAMYPLRVYDGGLVRAFSTDFLECGEASFYDYSFQNFSTFVGCSFTRSADFGLPFYLTQLYLQKVNGVTVSNCQFETIQPTGVEFNGNGIVGADARFSVLNGTVIDGYYNGITGYNWGTEAWTSFRVQACTLQNNFVGVASWGVNDIFVKNNVFQSIGSHPTSGVRRGLDLFNCKVYTVIDNSFVGVTENRELTIGVLAWNTGGEANEIKKNCNYLGCRKTI